MINILIEGMTSNKGGKESYIINMYNAFDKKRFHFSFIAYDDQIAYENYLTQNGAEIIHLPARNKGLMSFRNSIDRLISERQYDVVWAHKTTLSSCEILEIAKKHGIPLRIVHSHSSSNMGGKLTFLLHCINKKLVQRWANELFACSDTAAKWFFGRKSYKLQNNGIDIERFRFNAKTRERIRNKLELEDKLVIGHVGRFSIEKNHEKLINVFQQIHRKNPDTKLLLCGDGETREKIVIQIKELGLSDSVYLLGVIDNIHEVLQAVDIMVMPSLFEGLPFALLEAQAAGLKCVVSDTVSKEADILEWNVFLPLTDRDETWADRIIELSSQFYDRDKAADIMKLKGYDIYDCVKRVESIISNHISV